MLPGIVAVTTQSASIARLSSNDNRTHISKTFGRSRLAICHFIGLSRNENLQQHLFSMTNRKNAASTTNLFWSERIRASPCWLLLRRQQKWRAAGVPPPTFQHSVTYANMVACATGPVVARVRISVGAAPLAYAIHTVRSTRALKYQETHYGNNRPRYLPAVHFSSKV